MRRTLPVLLAATACVGVVKGTAVGPVVLVVSSTRGWGVHAGDLVVFPVMAASLWWAARDSSRG